MPHRSSRRRGTVLVFVMAILVLLALVGLSMMVTTHGARRQVTPQREALAYQTVLERSIELVQDELRIDLYADPKDPNTLLTRRHMADRGHSNEPNYQAAPNSNEPFDIPGPEDRWLASSYPHSRGTDPNLYWHRVTYLGPILPDAPGSGDPLDANGLVDKLDADPDPDKNEAMLTGLGLFHPDPNVGEPNGGIPRCTPAAGRELSLLPDGTEPWFDPALYRDIYDVDGNGRLDLYDADGDGVPDSPISFTFPVDTPTASDRPQRVHVAIRIIDNNAKVNVNTASSKFALDKTPSDTDPFKESFDESTPDLQLRGRRVGEVLLDAVARPDMVTGGGAYAIRELYRALWNYRGTLADFEMADEYLTYHNEVVRRKLLGGILPIGLDYEYPVYGMPDEVALAHRFCLVPYGARFLETTSGWTGRLTTDLLGTLCWSRIRGEDSALHFHRYKPDDPALSLWRWRRLGWDDRVGDDSTDPVLLGWQQLLDQEHPWVIKRGMLTTTNGVCDRRPANIRPMLSDAGDFPDLADDLQYEITTGGTTHYRRLLRPDEEVDPNNSSGRLLGWPYQRAYAFPVRVNGGNVEALSGLYDYEKVPLNYWIHQDVDAAEQAQLKADYVTMLAWAFYVSNSVKPTDGSTGEVDFADAAWQAAVNIADYRDTDLVPTVVKRGGNVIAAGIEPQPFITDVRITMGNNEVGNEAPHIMQVELLNPFVGADLEDGDVDFKVRVVNPDLDTGTVSEDLDASGGSRVRRQHRFEIAGAPGAGFTQATTVELYASVEGTDVVFDRFALDGTASVRATGSWQTDPGDINDYQRDEASTPWGFTIARSQLRNDTDAITLANTADLSADIKPSHWVIRNTGVVQNVDDADFPNWPGHWWTFDTPGELSRVLIWANGTTAGPVTELLAVEQMKGGATDDQKVAAGRLDFSRDDAAAEPNTSDPRNIFHYITALGANYDGIDNDGDGLIDVRANTSSVTPDPDTLRPTTPTGLLRSEAHRTSYRRVGVINVNTAPAQVMYAVPFMVEADLALHVKATPLAWDVAAGIVAVREARTVQSVFDKGGEADPGSSAKPKRFRTLGDLAQVSASVVGDDFAVDRWGPGGGQTLQAHADNPLSPDYDGSASAVPDPNGTDAHDGSGTVNNDIRDRDIFLARWGNILTTRSDVFTVYIALIDDDARYLMRSQFTIDRTPTMMDPNQPPTILGRVDTNYYDDTR